MTPRPGEVVLVLVPNLDGTEKTRPCLVLGTLPGIFQNTLVCGFSSGLDALEPDWDEMVDWADDDYRSIGLHAPSTIRLSFLYAADHAELHGVIGDVSPERLARLQKRLADRLLQSL